MESIERKVLQSLLLRWRDGALDEEGVHWEAESLWERGSEWPDYPKHDPISVAIEVLSNLDIINHQLIGREDIPAILSFLETREGKELEGWRAWEDYWSGIDYDLRERERGENPYYRSK